MAVVRCRSASHASNPDGISNHIAPSPRPGGAVAIAVMGNTEHALGMRGALFSSFNFTYNDKLEAL